MATSAKTILIVDDEPDILELLDLLLAGEGYRVLQAGGGAAAMAALAAERPDFVFLDIMMPDIDGHAVCAHIRGQERLRDVPVYMLTAKNDVAHIGRALDAGAHGFMVKPFDTEDLLRVVAACLGGERTDFYRSGQPAGGARPGDSRVACLAIAEPKAEFSVIVGVCEDQHYNLLSLWQRDEPTRCMTTALLNVTASEHFGTLLNRILAVPRVEILHCSIYRTIEEVPMHKLEHA
ncbi:MAG: response regulator [Lentisphaerae bacterium]|nr:response regulator [Lentisphaerota bacterium]